MFRLIFVPMTLAALCTSATAVGQPAPGRSLPYKMVLSIGGGTVVIDYPSRERCQAGLAGVDQENARRTEDARRRTEAMQRPDGRSGMVIPSIYTAFCISG